jgi:hypothetical protein
MESIDTIGWRPLPEAPLDRLFFAREGEPMEPASGPMFPADTTMTMSSWSHTNRSRRTADPSSITGAMRP